MRERTWWAFHVGSALVVLGLLGLHMAIMHLDTMLGWFNPEGLKPIAWESVLQRARMGFFTVSYIVLLGAALFHGLYGLRNILFELGPGPAVKKGLNALLTVGGLVTFVYGAWAAWAATALARTL